MATRKSSQVATSYEHSRACGILAIMFEMGYPVPLDDAEIKSVARGRHGLVDSVDLARKAIERDAVPALCIQRQVDTHGGTETVAMVDLVRPDDGHLHLAPLGVENKAPSTF